MKPIFSISFLIIAGILFFVIINPLYKDISKLRIDVNTYNLALNNSTDLQKIRDSLIDTYRKIKQEDKDRLERFLPNAVNNIQLILEIEKIASLYGMPIKNIKFEDKSSIYSNLESDTLVVEKDPSQKLPYGIFPIEFSIDGRYNDFISFLKDIEFNLRIIDIKSISFNTPLSTITTTTGAGMIDPNTYSYTLKAEIYWLK